MINSNMISFISIRKFLIFLFLFSFSTLISAPVTPGHARQVAENFYAHRYEHYLAETRPANAPERMEQNIRFEPHSTLTHKGHEVAYIFNRANGEGYIIISADDKAYPVLNYSFYGRFHPGNESIPPGLQWFINNYKEQIVYAIEEDVSPYAHTTHAWNNYYSGAVPHQIRSQSPLTDSIKWGQGCYFNALCPQDNNAGHSLCNRVPVGCVATAMAIVMRYHSYPHSGSGSHSYTSSYGTHSVDFGNSIYHWDNMPNQLTSHNTDVATIMYQAAVSVSMNFGPSGSGATFGHPSATPTAETALQDHFRFPNAQWELRSNNTLPAWENRLRESLDSLNPVIYAGGIHGFICDGYQGASNNHFHFNWGWSGAYNGYCYLNNIVPGGTGTGGGTGNYTSNQQAIFDVSPPSAPPVADFSVNATTISPGGTVLFSDYSQNVPTSWHWDFGDGSTSNERFPAHTYDSAGTFSVQLWVSNSHGADSILKTSHINVQQGSNITANIYTTVDTAFVSDVVSFTDASSGSPTSWTWDFGDGRYASSASSNHAFASPGDYTIKLTAANHTGSDTTSVQIHILPAPIPVAHFTADTTAIPAGTSVQFHDMSSNQPTSWEWDFGNGITSSQQNPSRAFQTPGTYTIKLTAANAYGADSIIKHDYLHVFEAPPQADFNQSQVSALDGEAIQFIDLSSGIVDNWHWNFGDGGTSSLQYPSYAYSSPGVYTVSLVVENNAGADTLTKENLITISGTNINENTNNNLYTIYPNPVTQTLFIESEEQHTTKTLQLRDSSGKTVISKKGISPQEEIHVSGLSQGLYLLEIITKDQVIHKKIMVH